jgi:hypothetical protein
VHRGLGADAHTDERRVEGKGDEGADGQAEALAVGVDREYGDPGGEAS